MPCILIPCRPPPFSCAQSASPTQSFRSIGPVWLGFYPPPPAPPTPLQHTVPRISIVSYVRPHPQPHLALHGAPAFCPHPPTDPATPRRWSRTLTPDRPRHPSTVVAYPYSHLTHSLCARLCFLRSRVTSIDARYATEHLSMAFTAAEGAVQTATWSGTRPKRTAHPTQPKPDPTPPASARCPALRLGARARALLTPPQLCPTRRQNKDRSRWTMGSTRSRPAWPPSPPSPPIAPPPREGLRRQVSGEFWGGFVSCAAGGA